MRVLARACGRAAPGAAANKRVFVQRAAQSDADSMETRGLQGSIRRSCRGAAPGSYHRRSRHRPGRCRDLRVPRAPWVSPDAPHSKYVCNPTPDRQPRDHPRPDNLSSVPITCISHPPSAHPQRRKTGAALWGTDPQSLQVWGRLARGPAGHPALTELEETVASVPGEKGQVCSG